MIKSSVIVMDLDGTICFPNLSEKSSEKRYGEAIPNQPVINKMKALSDDGWKFVILTARRMVTHNGDISKIIYDVGKITSDWLEKYEVPYEHIQWGKPYAAYYVDDKALTLEGFINL